MNNLKQIIKTGKILNHAFIQIFNSFGGCDGENQKTG